MTIILGLTGSIATGKSEVVKILQKKNIPVFDADKSTHDIYNQRATKNFFREILPEVVKNNQIDRQKLSQILTSNPDMLGKIETHVHPKVKQAVDNFIINGLKSHPEFIVLDIPLLFESHLSFPVDKIVVIQTPLERQKKWALSRPGMTEQKFEFILSRQLPMSEKAKKADYIIDNSGSLSDLEKDIETMLVILTSSKASTKQ